MVLVRVWQSRRGRSLRWGWTDSGHNRRSACHPATQSLKGQPFLGPSDATVCAVWQILRCNTPDAENIFPYEQTRCPIWHLDGCTLSKRLPLHKREGMAGWSLECLTSLVWLHIALEKSEAGQDRVPPFRQSIGESIHVWHVWYENLGLKCMWYLGLAASSAVTPGIHYMSIFRLL